MPADESPFLLIAVWSCAGLLLMLVLLMIRILSLIHVLKRSVSNMAAPAMDDSASGAETPSGGAFEIFLSEEPSRRALTKSEQFAAYRQWRQEKGMNWSNS